MAEIWGAAIAAGGALISAYASNKAKKEDRKAAKAATKDEAIFSSAVSQFEAEQEDYYSRLNKDRKQRGLDQFRQFSTVQNYAPNYTGDSRVQLPEKASIANILSNIQLEEAEQKEKMSQAGQIFEKLDDAENKVRRVLDPIGAKISRKDPVRKFVKKLF